MCLFEFCVGQGIGSTWGTPHSTGPPKPTITPGSHPKHLLPPPLSPWKYSSQAMEPPRKRAAPSSTQAAGTSASAPAPVPALSFGLPASAPSLEWKPPQAFQIAATGLVRPVMYFFVRVLEQLCYNNPCRKGSKWVFCEGLYDRPGYTPSLLPNTIIWVNSRMGLICAKGYDRRTKTAHDQQVPVGVSDHLGGRTVLIMIRGRDAWSPKI